MAVPEPTELVYPPRSSWLPAVFAVGLAFLIVGLFSWWPWLAIGAAVAAVALLSWLRRARADLLRLPRRQPLSTSPIPLKPPR